jgi:hypothetical protein
VTEVVNVLDILAKLKPELIDETISQGIPITNEYVACQYVHVSSQNNNT